MKPLIPEDFKMDNEPEETTSTIKYEKSFARYKYREFYKLKKNALQRYSDHMSLLFKKSEDYNEWNLYFVKLTPETGAKNTE